MSSEIASIIVTKEKGIVQHVTTLKPIIIPENQPISHTIEGNLNINELYQWINQIQSIEYSKHVYDPQKELDQKHIFHPNSCSQATIYFNRAISNSRRSYIS